MNDLKGLLEKWIISKCFIIYKKNYRFFYFHPGKWDEIFHQNLYCLTGNQLLSMSLKIFWSATGFMHLNLYLYQNAYQLIHLLILFSLSTSKYLFIFYKLFNDFLLKQQTSRAQLCDAREWLRLRLRYALLVQPSLVITITSCLWFDHRQLLNMLEAEAMKKRY